MHVSIVVILIMESQSVLNPSIKLGSIKPSLNSPNQEADVMAVGLAVMAKDVDVVQAVDVVVIATKSTLAASGRAIIRVQIHFLLPLASRNEMANGA
jgi:hypothetical protein